MPNPPNLAEIQIRTEIEDEVRAEFAAVEAHERNSQIDRRLAALIVSVSFAALIGLPMLGLAVGLAVRVFRWTSGL